MIYVTTKLSLADVANGLILFGMGYSCVDLARGANAGVFGQHRLANFQVTCWFNIAGTGDLIAIDQHSRNDQGR